MSNDSEHWVLFDRDWNENGEHEEVEGEVAVFRFPALVGEVPSQAVSRWVKSFCNEDDAGFDYTDAHTGTYEIVDEDDELLLDQIVVKSLRQEPWPDSKFLRCTVYQIRTVDGTREVKLDPWANVVQPRPCVVSSITVKGPARVVAVRPGLTVERTPDGDVVRGLDA